MHLAGCGIPRGAVPAVTRRQRRQGLQARTRLATVRTFLGRHLERSNPLGSQQEPEDEQAADS